MRNGIVVAALSIAILSSSCAAFYLPGLEPVAYSEGDDVFIRVNTLRSLSTLVPYPYYHLPFCKPDVIYKRQESLGEILWGDDIESSLYSVKMKTDNKCQLLKCGADANKEFFEQMEEVRKFINEGYRGHMSIDNLPGYNNGSQILFGRCENIPLDQQNLFMRGYAIGVAKSCIGKTLLNNHLEFNIAYNQPDPAVAKYVVVGFTITPYSVKHSPGGGSCNNLFDPQDQKVEPLTMEDLRNSAKQPQGTDRILPYWSFSVNWHEEPNVRWASRWDAYLSTSFADTNARVHWLYIINSLLISLCLSTIAGMILLRTLHKDFNRYNSPDPDEQQEEVGWKLVHADVFRPPPRASFLAVVLGSGTQILLMCFGTLIFALLGFLSPANRGMLLTTMILVFVLLSFVSGYTCARFLKFFDARAWKTIFINAVFFPGGSFICWFIINTLNWHVHAANAVPFMTLLTLLGLWLGISVPLVVLGASFGFHQETLTVPVKVGKLAREIPVQRWYLSPPFTLLVPAIVPFGATFLELKFILASLWQGLVYYVFGFLALVFLVWLITIALTTIIVVYYQLCFEDYRWWWRSLAIPSAFGLHFFLYAVYYYQTSLTIHTSIGTFLYFAYMAIAAVAYGLASGTMGFYSAFIFIRKIYGSIKID